MEAKFDPKAKVKQGQFSDAPDGKQPNREHTNIDFSLHAPKKYQDQTGNILILTFLYMHLKNIKSMTMIQLYLVSQDQSMFRMHCLIWLTKKIINEPWTQEQFYTCHLCRD